MRLTVGISDSLPKLIAYRLLQATQNMDTQVRLVCMEDEFENLLADLALGKLDVVLTDRTVRAGGSLKVFSHLLGESDMKLFGTPKLARRYRRNFPASLDGAPLLLPTRNNALRGRIDAWLVQHGVRPEIVGEFEDNAMLNTFGRNGLGMFFAPSAWRKISKTSSAPCWSAMRPSCASTSTPSPTPAKSPIPPSKPSSTKCTQDCLPSKSFKMQVSTSEKRRSAPMQNFLLVVLAIFLVALNGFFVAAEFGIVTLRKTRVRAIAKTQGSRGASSAKSTASWMPICRPASSASRWPRWAWAGSANRRLPACWNRC
jgi:hypothetical protein